MGKARHKSRVSQRKSGDAPATGTFSPFGLIAVVLGAVAVGALLDTIFRSGLLGFGNRSLAGKSFPLDLPADLRREMEVKPGYD